MSTIDDVLNKLNSNQPAALERLQQLLRIPSISTDSAYAPQCQQAAEWLQKQLTEIGFEAKICPTKGRPVVIAHAKGTRPDVPHVLFYGHYDVQPADPVSLWESPPFEPRITEKQIFARGSSDDKGQLMTFVEACRAFKEVGGLPCEVTIMLEGEEESGSPSLNDFLQEHKDELSADLALVCDTVMWDEKTPAVTGSLRGSVNIEVTIKGANRDLHSGFYGGVAVNPIHVLADVIAGLHDQNGEITLEGFYDGIDDLPPDLLKKWNELGFDEREFLGDVGLSRSAGEKGRSTLEQLWSRPTCDINGITGGYTGVGSKTIIPAQASAKFSFRLVGHQDPQKVIDAFKSYVNGRMPQDCKAEFVVHGSTPPLDTNFNSETLARARRALQSEWQVDPVVIGSGGSIPVVGAFKRDLKMDTLMIGFALEDDCIHSPNEKYNLTSFFKGARSWARILTNLAAV